MTNQLIKAAINGAAGRMGQAIAEMIEKYADITVARAYERPNSTAISQRLSEMVRSRSQIKVEPSDTMDASCFDVLIDFSTPISVINAAHRCLQSQRPMVIGVTGFSDEQKQELQDLAKKIPILMSPNMSIGINLCFKLLEQIAQTAWGNDAEVRITEKHHWHKKDTPSGTALKMSEIIAKARHIKASDIPIKAHREGEVTGEHRVLFFTPQERIELKHKATDRSPFADGAIHAARWLATTHPKPGSLYTMHDILN